MVRSDVGPDETARVKSRRLALVVVLSAAFMELIDASIVNVAIPSIRTDLGASVSAIEFVLAGYLLAFAVTLITGGRLGDLYGRRRMFMLGMAGFTVASILCASAPTAEVLVAGRVVQGLFAGLMFPQVLTIIQVSYAPEERAAVFGTYGATLGMATIFGPILGGLLISLDLFGLGWRAIFFVNVPIGVAALLLAARNLPESRSERAEGLDPTGVLVVTAGLFLLVYPLVEGRRLDWPAWSFLMLGASAPVLVLFVLLQHRRGRLGRPQLVALNLFRERAFSSGLVFNLAFFLGVVPFFFTLTFYLQAGEGFSALRAGLTLLPFAIGASVTSATSGVIAKKLGSKVLVLGCLVLIVGLAGLVLTLDLAGSDLSAFQLIPALFVSGLGLGLVVAPVTTVVLAGIHHDDAGSASGVLATMQEVAGAAGVAVIGLIFFGQLATNADYASAKVSPGLRSDLVATGLPSSEVDAILTGFSACFKDRSSAEDAAAVPASCQGQSGPQSDVVEGAAQRANEINFSRTMQHTLWFECGAFLLALLAGLALPRIDPERLEEVSLEGH